VGPRQTPYLGTRLRRTTSACIRAARFPNTPGYVYIVFYIKSTSKSSTVLKLVFHRYPITDELPCRKMKKAVCKLRYQTSGCSSKNCGYAHILYMDRPFEQSETPHSSSWVGCQGGVRRPRYSRGPPIRCSVSGSKERGRRQRYCSKTCARERLSSGMCALGTCSFLIRRHEAVLRL